MGKRGPASDMPPGGPYADRQAKLCGNPGGCGTVSWTDGIVRVEYKHLINHDWGRLTTGRSPYWSIRVSDSLSVRGSALRGAWQHGVLRQAVTRKQWGWEDAGAWRFMDGVTCDDMSGEVHIKLLSRGDTSEVRRAGLRAGRFVEAGPRAGSSPFLFVCGDDRVIRYTGADVDTGGAEDAQMADSPFLFVCGDDRVIRYTGADVDTGGAEDAQMAE
ncbi:hypothetical protein DEO72_LG8g1664 [Vigna unguiculata]|uniref:Uncharacterized protein n=1 Tax=Vigna unguiculata TaxID=3917 RepID=A0A4D6MU45_VIGUN|nr:hypothetical protein DEO72_LG8g1664 [Vigna unguiculata]